MRTTVDIPDPVYRQLKSRAALKGCSVRELILQGVQEELKGEISKSVKNRVELPLVKSKKPGWLKLTNKSIDEIIFP